MSLFKYPGLNPFEIRASLKHPSKIGDRSVYLS